MRKVLKLITLMVSLFWIIESRNSSLSERIDIGPHAVIHYLCLKASPKENHKNGNKGKCAPSYSTVQKRAATVNRSPENYSTTILIID